ncbi:NAD(P) transhydrogenase subunit alpha [Bifidobacterium simiarum]|uniref:proton-translocating NAD(P)(+) transhydrogenase n=1 Tax=Bifidobacterium simiarum TaxID=2045441 RepID=A0A2M9HCH6_9BIFI|nr:NAD(P) transhydrogenase subunit alpha [Bifidobacterium simiarum]PJM74514.1 NAD(P) transhydrogenase subunit alpha [Bifidobacterium simiarum]
MAEDTQSTITYGIFNETAEHESRVALTPDIVKRLKRSGVDCVIERNAGHAAGFSDDDYVKAGAKVATRDEIIAQSQAFGFVDRPDAELIDRLPKGSWVIGMLGSFTDQAYVDHLEQAGLVGVAIEKLPRQLSSAQSMDEMTSQNSVMGYKAVLKAADAYGSFFPMMTTAAGTIRPAKVLILGAGIAGLQAIGTARRLGAVVTAYDVRPAAKGEVLSLGAKFLDLGLDFSQGQGEGGYARQLTAEEQAAQQAAVDQKAAEFDVVITTAKVPGRKPPMLLTKAGVDGLHRGAVIVDCAASDLGGNVEGSKPNQTLITDNGVQLIGAPDLASGVATTASNLLARNVADVLAHFVTDGKLAMDLGEELDDALVVAGRVEAPAQAAEETSKESVEGEK